MIDLNTVQDVAGLIESPLLLILIVTFVWRKCRCFRLQILQWFMSVKALKQDAAKATCSGGVVESDKARSPDDVIVEQNQSAYALGIDCRVEGRISGLPIEDRLLCRGLWGLLITRITLKIKMWLWHSNFKVSKIA